jgi:stage III sporulation protein AA
MEIQNFLPMAFRAQVDGSTLRGAEEIRLRVGQPLEILYADGKSRSFDSLSAEQMREMLNYLSGYSVYTMEEELRQGFFTLEGGHRVGVSGRTSYQKKGTKNVMNVVSDISGLNIRIAHEKKGCAIKILPWIYRDTGIYHTFLFAPPGVGKTTYLRDCIRLLSSGDGTRRGIKVGVVDERSEIAACHLGVPQNDLGFRVDVLDNCPKEQGMKMLLRSMSPEIIAVDELGLPEDFAAVRESARSGVAVLGTIHAGTVEEVQERLETGGLLGLFSSTRLVGVKRLADGSRALGIYEGGGRLLWEGCSEAC